MICFFPGNFGWRKPIAKLRDGEGEVCDGGFEECLHELQKEEAAVREVGLLLDLQQRE
jgi:hypothetical protein